MPKENCWEILNCPEERKSRCPAFQQDLGRRCWRTSGTLCQGDTDSVVDKLLGCLDCKVYHRINRIAWYQTTYCRFAVLSVLPALAVYFSLALFNHFFEALSPGSYLLAVLAGGILLATVVSAPAFQMMKPVDILRQKLREIGRGELTTAEAMMPRRDEFMLLAIALNDLKEMLRGTIQAMDNNGSVLTTATEQLTAHADQTAAGAQETAGTIGELVSTVDDVRDNVNTVATGAGTTAEHASKGGRHVVELQSSFQSIESATREAATAVEELHAKSGEIGRITDLITQIADQTNLLALNAAIEAARAGKQGRGFAVVAEEVRKLAEESGSAAKSIHTLILDTQTRTQHVTDMMARNREQVQSGASVVSKVNQTFRDIDSRVQELTKNLQSVADAARQMSEGMNTVAATTQQQTAAAEEVSAAAHTLTNLAEKSRTLVKKFKF